MFRKKNTKTLQREYLKKTNIEKQHRDLIHKDTMLFYICFICDLHPFDICTLEALRDM